MFDERHLLMASVLPLGRMELLVDDMVPRASAGSCGATMARARPSAPPSAWPIRLYGVCRSLTAASQPGRRPAFALYSGVHVPSKAFAEVVEHEPGTPWISAEELRRWSMRGSDIAIFDSRSYEEYHNNTIPGAISVPGAELVYRFKDLVPSPDTIVIVNCGGRTRSIIGAQSLINAGVPNKVVSLKDGTMAWHLAGYEVVKARSRRAAACRMPAAAPRSTQPARVAAVCDIPRIDCSDTRSWQR